MGMYAEIILLIVCILLTFGSFVCVFGVFAVDPGDTSGALAFIVGFLLSVPLVVGMWMCFNAVSRFVG